MAQATTMPGKFLRPCIVRGLFLVHTKVLLVQKKKEKAMEGRLIYLGLRFGLRFLSADSRMNLL